jgi:hypothetical protein
MDRRPGHVGRVRGGDERAYAGDIIGSAGTERDLVHARPLRRRGQLPDRCRSQARTTELTRNPCGPNSTSSDFATSVMGEVATQLAVDDVTEFDLSFFAPGDCLFGRTRHPKRAHSPSHRRQVARFVGTRHDQSPILDLICAAHSHQNQYRTNRLLPAWPVTRSGAG